MLVLALFTFHPMQHTAHGIRIQRPTFLHGGYPTAFFGTQSRREAEAEGVVFIQRIPHNAKTGVVFVTDFARISKAPVLGRAKQHREVDSVLVRDARLLHFSITCYKTHMATNGNNT